MMPPILDEPSGIHHDTNTAPVASTAGLEAPEREPLRVNVYVDGFNLYFGCLENTPYRWLDISQLVRNLLQPMLGDFTLNRIRYFTARVSDRPESPGSSLRQLTYLRALGSISTLSLHLGQFKTNKRSYKLADGSGFAEVIRSEEKGSDVNLASYLIIDAVDHCYDVALVISNDTDLVLPIELTRQRFAVAIGVSAPCYFRNRRPMADLERVSDFQVHIRPEHKQLLAASQFPVRVESAHGGAVVRPERWAPQSRSG
ncbi:MAG: NYN domain-containing protein [Dehalococcoidia bacterium]|nr:NYN domain-containing protein [Dehalococcoidia bacterium]